jgi:hypothetical protein
VVQTASILERLARREREARVRTSGDLVRERPARTDDANVRNVHLSDKVGVGEELVPAGVDAHDWASWGEEARYVLLERLGVGAELGMAEADALRLAVVEARMVQAGVPVASWSFVGQALRVFEGSRIVAVELRSKP